MAVRAIGRNRFCEPSTSAFHPQPGIRVSVLTQPDRRSPPVRCLGAFAKTEIVSQVRNEGENEICEAALVGWRVFSGRVHIAQKAGMTQQSQNWTWCVTKNHAISRLSWSFGGLVDPSM
jgi:hypothetical protein